MSTFYGGEQLVDIFALTGVTTVGTGDIYIVPAGFYASLNILKCSLNSGLAIFSPAGNVTNVTTISNTAGTSMLFLTSGGKVANAQDFTEYHITIRLYKNP